jgi:cysteine desulfuration protein SufE
MSLAAPRLPRARNWEGFCPFLPICAPQFLFEAGRYRRHIQHMDAVSATVPVTSFDEILADFELLDDWEDRYRYVIELGRKLEQMSEAEHSAANKVQGCVSQVWLATRVDRSGVSPRLSFIGDSDAHIVRGLIAILFALYSGKTADEILAIDATEKLSLLHLNEHLTPQRSNGLMAMVRRIKTDAEHEAGDRKRH